MKPYDLEEYVKSEIETGERKGWVPGYNGQVLQEVKKVKISHKLETKDHKFDDGETVKIANKLTIEIDFGDVIMQPYSYFEEEFCYQCADVIAGNIEGAWDNYEG